MESTAKGNFVRMSARKVRLVADEIRGYEMIEAIDILKHMKKKASEIILKILYSAGANAKILNPDIDEKELYVKKIYVDEGITMKRFRPRARGRGSRILKRTSKVTVVLSDE